MRNISKVFEIIRKPVLGDVFFYAAIRLAHRDNHQLFLQILVGFCHIAEHFPQLVGIGAFRHQARVCNHEFSFRVWGFLDRIEVFRIISVGNDFNLVPECLEISLRELCFHLRRNDRDTVSLCYYGALQLFVFSQRLGAEAKMLEVKNPCPRVSEISNPRYVENFVDFSGYQMHRMRRSGADNGIEPLSAFDEF